MEELIEFEDELFAIEIGIVEGWWIAAGRIVEGREVGEGVEIVAVTILDDAVGLISVEVAVVDEDVLFRADGLSEVEGDDAFLGVGVNGGEELPALVGCDAKA